MTVFAYSTGFGCLCTTRNYVGEALGKGRNLYAKKLASYCYLFSIFMGLIWTSLLIIFVDQITHCFTQVESSYLVLRQFILLYSICSTFDFIIATSINVMRMIDRIYE